jgi:hypothetical protein
MNTSMFEPMLRDATIKAIDSVAKKLTDTERAAESGVARLLSHWNQMDTDEKEHVAGIVIATATTVTMGLLALRRKAKAPLKTAGKAIAKRVTKRA